MPTRQEIIDYITQAAQRRGIDPNTVLKVVRQESGFNPAAANDKTGREKSYGLFQLNVQGGLGNEARKRGIEPTDPSQWKQHVDFSLDTVKRDGWRQWGGARDTGTSRWAGVNSKGPKNIDLGSEPTLQNLSPPTKPTRNVRPEDSAEAAILKQSAPTEPEQVSEMARPSVKDAIRQSMDELGIKDQLQYAGFVPPGLTKGSAKTRAAASANVQPRGTRAEGVAAERLNDPRFGPYDQVAPTSRGMEGSYADYVKREKERMAFRKADEEAGRKGGGDQLPPGVKSATDPAGAVDPRTGTAVAPYDPNLAAQNDPARQALIAQKIRGYARQGGEPPPPNAAGAAPGQVPNAAKAAAATAAVAAGVSAGRQDEDPALKAVQDKVQGRTANVDPGVEERGRQMGLKPGQMSDPNTGYQTMAAGPMIGQALPVFKEAMRDPQTAQAVKTAATGMIKAKARMDAQAADQKNDPTYYQMRAARAQQQPGGGGGGDPIADRAMERAVMMDNARRGSSTPQTIPRPQQSVPPQQTTRGTVSVRPTTEQDIVNQAIPPGAEKGDVPPPTGRTPVPPGFPQDQPVRNMTAGQAYPPGAPITPEVTNPSGPMQAPQMNPQMMDPVMMQLMQFFTQGGAGGEVG